MKKIILVSVSILVLIFACSKDDEGPIGGSSANLIGTWSLDYYIENGKLTEEIICDELVEYVFSSNGSYKVTTFSGTTASNCATAVQINGMWENMGNNEYILTPNGGTAGPALSVTFQDNFKKFSSEVSTSRTEVYSKK